MIHTYAILQKFMIRRIDMKNLSTGLSAESSILAVLISSATYSSHLPHAQSATAFQRLISKRALASPEPSLTPSERSPASAPVLASSSMLPAACFSASTRRLLDLFACPRAPPRSSGLAIRPQPSFSKAPRGFRRRRCSRSPSLSSPSFCRLLHPSLLFFFPILHSLLVLSILYSI